MIGSETAPVMGVVGAAALAHVPDPGRHGRSENHRPVGRRVGPADSELGRDGRSVRRQDGAGDEVLDGRRHRGPLGEHDVHPGDIGRPRRDGGRGVAGARVRRPLRLGAAGERGDVDAPGRVRHQRRRGGVVQLDLVDLERDRRRVRQDELVREVHLPVGHLDRRRCRQEHRRELGELRRGVVPALEAPGSGHRTGRRRATGRRAWASTGLRARRAGETTPTARPVTSARSARLSPMVVQARRRYVDGLETQVQSRRGPRPRARASRRRPPPGGPRPPDPRCPAHTARVPTAGRGAG